MTKAECQKRPSWLWDFCDISPQRLNLSSINLLALIFTNTLIPMDTDLKNIVNTLEAEVTSLGFEALKTPQQVKNLFSQAEGTMLAFVNSLCGCAGGAARAALQWALEQTARKPQRLVTVFGGIDQEATDLFFSFTKPFPASSPAIALFKDGMVVHFVERHHVQSSPMPELAKDLQKALEAHCA